MTGLRSVAHRIRASTGTSLATAAAALSLGLTWGVSTGEARIGVAITGALVMLLPWHPTGGPPPDRRSPAAGWRVTGLGVAVLGGLEGIAELSGLPVELRTIAPSVVALPLVAYGLWLWMVRPRRASRVALDALLMGLAIGLACWQTLIDPLFAALTQQAAVMMVLVVMTGFLLSLVALTRSSGGAVGVEVVIAMAAASAYAVAILLVEDADMIMRSWSAVADATGHALTTMAVIIGQRRQPLPQDLRAVEVTVPWFPSTFAVTTLLASILKVNWTGETPGQVDGLLSAVVLVALAGRIAMASRDRQHARRRLEDMAHHDAVTGLRNRAWLSAVLPERLARGAVSAVLMLDVDHFKLVNDGLGHHVGDRVLAVMGDRLRIAIGADDVVRLGGDEFLVLLGPAQPEDPGAVAERVRLTLAEPIRFDSYALRPTVSVGVAIAADVPPGELLRSADAALYRAKEDGRNTVVIDDRELQRTSARRRRIASQLLPALESGAVSLHHQPVIEAATGAVVLLEGLVRWHSPELGDVGPTELVAVAEQSGLLGPFNRWAVDQACASVARLDGHPALRGVRVTLNVATARLAHTGFVDDVLATLRRRGVGPDRLVLEVTESALLDRGGPALGALRALAAAGVGIAVDDFGSGYTAFGYLPDSPVDLIKLDPSFTRRLGVSDRPTLVGIVIDMAHDLGIGVVAEGVETPQQREQLLAMGCGLLQGHLLAPPAPLDVILQRTHRPAAVR